MIFPVVACRRLFSVVTCPNPHEDDAKLLEFSKGTEDGPCRAGRLSKTFPEMMPNSIVGECGELSV